MGGRLHWRKEGEWGAEDIGAGNVKWYLIFWMDGNIIDIKEQMYL